MTLYLVYELTARQDNFDNIITLHAVQFRSNLGTSTGVVDLMISRQWLAQVEQ